MPPWNWNIYQAIYHGFIVNVGRYSAFGYELQSVCTWNGWLEYWFPFAVLCLFPGGEMLVLGSVNGTHFWGDQLHANIYPWRIHGTGIFTIHVYLAFIVWYIYLPTVDGGNPAPPGTYKTMKIMGCGAFSAGDEIRWKTRITLLRGEAASLRNSGPEVVLRVLAADTPQSSFNFPDDAYGLDNLF